MTDRDRLIRRALAALYGGDFRLLTGNAAMESLAEELVSSDRADVEKIIDALGVVEMAEALGSAIQIADEARREWDAAPSGMRAGKVLIALAGGCKGYRADIDKIHAALARVRGEPGEREDGR